MTEKATHGGPRKGAGRKKDPNAPKVRGIRCTDAGWEWLRDQAKAAGKTSVGKWADAEALKNNRPERQKHLTQGKSNAIYPHAHEIR